MSSTYVTDDELDLTEAAAAAGLDDAAADL